MMANSTREFLCGVLIGSAVGAAAALLYAPASGTETRETIRAKTVEARDKATELANQARARAEELQREAQAVIDKARHAVETQKEAVRTAVEAGKQAYTEKKGALSTDDSA
jgi:gas vesicle protein